MHTWIPFDYTDVIFTQVSMVNNYFSIENQSDKKRKRLKIQILNCYHNSLGYRTPTKPVASNSKSQALLINLILLASYWDRKKSSLKKRNAIRPGKKMLLRFPSTNWLNSFLTWGNLHTDWMLLEKLPPQINSLFLVSKNLLVVFYNLLPWISTLEDLQVTLNLK